VTLVFWPLAAFSSACAFSPSGSPGTAELSSRWSSKQDEYSIPPAGEKPSHAQDPCPPCRKRRAPRGSQPEQVVRRSPKKTSAAESPSSGPCPPIRIDRHIPRLRAPAAGAHSRRPPVTARRRSAKRMDAPLEAGFCVGPSASCPRRASGRCLEPPDPDWACSPRNSPASSIASRSWPPRWMGPSQGSMERVWAGVRAGGGDLAPSHRGDGRPGPRRRAAGPGRPLGAISTGGAPPSSSPSVPRPQGIALHHRQPPCKYLAEKEVEASWQQAQTRSPSAHGPV